MERALFGDKKNNLSTESGHLEPPLKVVADAAMGATGLGDGRMIPLVIVDTTWRPDIDDLLKIHEQTPPGDATTQWAQLLDTPHHVLLVVKFVRPVEKAFTIDFDVKQRGGVVDQAMHTRAIYIQGGRPGDRFVTTVSAPRILMELGAGGFENEWEKLWFKALVAGYRERGVTRGEAKQMAKQHMAEFRENLRMRVR